MRKIVLIFLLVNLTAFGGICVKRVENPGTDPYLNYVLLQRIEQALLEVGKKVECSENSRELVVSIKRLKDIPLAFSPEQRVTSYTLEVVVSIKLDGKEAEFFWSVPYEQTNGLQGELPRREAFEDAVDKISIQILDFLKDL